MTIWKKTKVQSTHAATAKEPGAALSDELPKRLLDASWPELCLISSMRSTSSPREIRHIYRLYSIAMYTRLCLRAPRPSELSSERQRGQPFTAVRTIRDVRISMITRVSLAPERIGRRRQRQGEVCAVPFHLVDVSMRNATRGVGCGEGPHLLPLTKTAAGRLRPFRTRKSRMRLRDLTAPSNPALLGTWRLRGPQLPLHDPLCAWRPAGRLHRSRLSSKAAPGRQWGARP